MALRGEELFLSYGVMGGFMQVRGGEELRFGHNRLTLRHAAARTRTSAFEHAFIFSRFICLESLDCLAFFPKVLYL